MYSDEELQKPDALQTLIGIVDGGVEKHDDYELWEAVDGLLRLGKKAGPAKHSLVRLTRGGGGTFHETVRHVLSNIGKEALPAIFEGMKHSDANEFSIARLALTVWDIGCSESDVLNEVESLLKSSRFDLQLWGSILHMYLSTNPKPNMQVLKQASQNDDRFYLQWHALLCMGRLKEEKAEVLKFLKSRHKHLSKYAKSIKWMKPARTFDAILSFFKKQEDDKQAVTAAIAAHVSLTRLENNLTTLQDLEEILGEYSEWDPDLVVEIIRLFGDIGSINPKLKNSLKVLANTNQPVVSKTASSVLNKLESNSGVAK